MKVTTIPTFGNGKLFYIEAGEYSFSENIIKLFNSLLIEYKKKKIENIIGMSAPFTTDVGVVFEDSIIVEMNKRESMKFVYEFLDTEYSFEKQRMFGTEVQKLIDVDDYEW